MKIQTETLKNMTSVMLFDASETQSVTDAKFDKWLRKNKGSSLGDRNVPTAAETRRLLYANDVT